MKEEVDEEHEVLLFLSRYNELINGAKAVQNLFFKMAVI